MREREMQKQKRKNSMYVKQRKRNSILDIMPVNTGVAIEKRIY